MRYSRKLLFAAAAAGVVITAPAGAAVMKYQADLTALNSSGVSGTAYFTHDTSANTLTVNVQARGLAAGQVHPQHIHGLFAPSSCTDTAPAGSPVAGFCLDGTAALESSVPTIANDVDGDGFVETLEGAAAYGPILLNLANAGATPADLPGAFPTADAMGRLSFTATYDLATTPLLFDPVFGIEHEAGDLLDLTNRVYVIHGLVVNRPGGGMFEVTADTQPGSYVALLPAAAGELERVPEPAALGLMGLGLMGLAGLRRRKARS